MKPRVIFATTVFDAAATGPGIYAQYLWRAFSDDPDLEFHLICPTAAQSHPNLHTLDGSAAGGSLYHRIAAAAMALATGQEDRTIVHGNAAHAMFDFVNYPGPWVVQVNDYEVADFPARAIHTLLTKGPRRVLSLAWRRRQEKRVIPAATRVVCNSHYTQRMIQEAYHPDPERVMTIYKAVDTSQFERPVTLPPDPLPHRQGSGRLVLIGTHWDIKGLDLLLRAIPDVTASCGKLSLAVAGAPQVGRNPRMVKLAAKLGLTGQVDFVGRLDRHQVATLLWHSDVMVMPSRQEGFGVAALEAMAAGLPVVAARTGGLPEIIADESCGVLCEPESVGSLADALKEVLSRSRSQPGLNDRAVARAGQFNTARMIEAVRRLYMDIVF